MKTLTGHVTDAQAQRLLDALLADDEAAAVETHAAACVECQATIESYRMLAGALEALGDDLPALPADFTAGVLDVIDARERAEARERRLALGILAAVATAALAAFAAAGAGAWAPTLSSVADGFGTAARAFRITSGFVPAIVGALRLEIILVAAALALPLLLAFARLMPPPRAEVA
jgi:anti-sigma factor RsiW